MVSSVLCLEWISSILPSVSIKMGAPSKISQQFWAGYVFQYFAQLHKGSHLCNIDYDRSYYL